MCDDLELDTMSNDDKRAMILAQRKSKIERYKVLAQKHWAAYESLKKQNESLDFAFTSAPILVGHYSQKSNERARARMQAALNRQTEHYNKACYFDAEVKRLQDESAIRIKGDAESKRNELRANKDTIIVGSTVDTPYGLAEVIKVNKKTIRVKYSDGLIETHDKIGCRLVRGASNEES